MTIKELKRTIEAALSLRKFGKRFTMISFVGLGILLLIFASGRASRPTPRVASRGRMAVLAQTDDRPWLDELNSEQRAWLTQYFQQFHDMLHSSRVRDPLTGYRAAIDVP